MFLWQDALGKSPVPMIDDGGAATAACAKTLATTSNATAVTTMTTQHGSR
jgi:hypothetical protein